MKQTIVNSDRLPDNQPVKVTLIRKKSPDVPGESFGYRPFKPVPIPINPGTDQDGSKGYRPRPTPGGISLPYVNPDRPSDNRLYRPKPNENGNYGYRPRPTDNKPIPFNPDETNKYGYRPRPVDDRVIRAQFDQEITKRKKELQEYKGEK